MYFLLNKRETCYPDSGLIFICWMTLWNSLGAVPAQLCTAAFPVHKHVHQMFKWTWKQDLIHWIGFWNIQAVCSYNNCAQVIGAFLNVEATSLNPLSLISFSQEMGLTMNMQFMARTTLQGETFVQLIRTGLCLCKKWPQEAEVQLEWDLQL